MDTRRDILLTGASGYVGGRLLRALEARGHTVRCLARHPEFVAARAAPGTAVVRGDCLDADSLRGVCDGIGTVYYLVHSMASPGDFAARERVAARNLGDAARVAGVRRIIYLGGLGDRDHLSQHLRSRHETGAVLRASGVPVVELGRRGGRGSPTCWRRSCSTAGESADPGAAALTAALQSVAGPDAYDGLRNPDARLRLASEMKLPGRAAAGPRLAGSQFDGGG